jgi:hypothetical protein
MRIQGRWCSVVMLVLASGCLGEKDVEDVVDSGQVTEVDAGAVDAGQLEANPARDFCRELVALQVAASQRCGSLSDAGVAETVDAMRADCEKWPLPRRGFSDTAAEACLQLHRAATCTTVIDPAVCEAVTPGLVEADGACFSGPECASGLYCDPSATCPGVCRPRVAIGQPASFAEQCVPEAFLTEGMCAARVSLGASCAASTPLGARRECVQGGFCNTSSICVALSLGGPGDDCTAPVYPPCALGLSCEPPDGCVAFVGEGEACGFFGPPCQEGLVCASSVCVRPGVKGETCNFEKTCAPNHFCERVPGQFDGVCTLRIAAGQPCDSHGNVICEPGLFCDVAGSGTCEPQLPMGSACSLDEECRPLARCSGQPTKTCTPLGSVGAACVAGNDCLSGTCLSSRCTAASFCVEP